MVKDDTTSNTEVQEQEPSDIVLSIIPTDQESIPQHYMPTHNDVFMDLIIFGVSLDDVCSKYDITKGDVGIMLEEIYKDLSDRVIPMDDVKEAIKKDLCRGLSCTFQLGGVKYGRKKIKHEYPSSSFTK